MNKYFVLVFFFCFNFLFSQNGTPILIEGVVIDENSDETLPLANIIINDIYGNMIGGTTANTFGEFKISLNSNNPTVIINASYIGYNNYKQTLPLLELKSIPRLTIKMKTEELNAVDIISDQAESRKTPVSLSNVKLEKIEQN